MTFALHTVRQLSCIENRCKHIAHNSCYGHIPLNEPLCKCDTVISNYVEQIKITDKIKGFCLRTVSKESYSFDDKIHFLSRKYFISILRTTIFIQSKLNQQKQHEMRFFFAFNQDNKSNNYPNNQLLYFLHLIFSPPFHSSSTQKLIANRIF